MLQSQAELAQELVNLRDLLSFHRRRRLELQKKQAMRGFDTPAEVLIEIDDITKQIRDYEEEIAQREAVAAAGQVPIEEVEYRAMLAEEWDQSVGRLKVAQNARLDWARVRLGISSERARVMEQEVRRDIAHELFDDLNLSYLPLNYANMPQPRSAFNFNSLRKAILLDITTAIQLLQSRILLQTSHSSIHLDAVTDALLDPDASCRIDDQEQYQQFLNMLRDFLA